MSARAADWGLLPIAVGGALGAALGRGIFRLAGLWAAGWALWRLWLRAPEVAGARRSARLDQAQGRALLAGEPGTGAGPGAVEASQAIAPEPEDAGAARGARDPREEEFEAQREAAREENRAVEVRQHAPRGPEGIP
ncbi:hypothetical protein [Anaeromyxobacter paludicola]|uniref:Uncharacterized protein n=1 Tax=Anaeromyxobacter paludicola TaxID=2918171 RepID=A0ABM7XA42_9BACT|nr:hypothetical protein [Anaeromyxobacter paludicola]BDG08713.1 hypothetical protein AMPC_18260 [Anaeromyxobacter paludicola]